MRIAFCGCDFSDKNIALIRSKDGVADNTDTLRRSDAFYNEFKL